MDAPSLIRPRRSRAVLAAGGLFLGLTLVEVGFRVVDSPNRTQGVRGRRSLEMRVVRGVPVWRSLDGSPPRENLDCTDRPSVSVFGSSILYGSGLPPEEVFTGLLQEARPDLCVHNFAQPAYDFNAKLVRLQEHLAVARPELVIWEVWATDADPYTLVGETAWRLDRFNHEPGRPPDPFGIPGHDFFFAHLRAYEWATFALAEPQLARPNPWPEIADRTADMWDLVRSVGVDVLVVTCPVLDRPFAASAHTLTDFEEAIVPRARAAEVRSLRLAEALVSEDVEALRHDTCCHYNAAGHRVIADVLSRELPQPR